MTRVNSTPGCSRRNIESLLCRIIIVNTEQKLMLTQDVTFNIEKCKKTLKYDDKLAFSNSSTHLCSKATQGMHCVTKEKLSKRKHVVSIYA